MNLRKGSDYHWLQTRCERNGIFYIQWSAHLIIQRATPSFRSAIEDAVDWEFLNIFPAGFLVQIDACQKTGFSWSLGWKEMHATNMFVIISLDYPRTSQHSTQSLPFTQNLDQVPLNFFSTFRNYLSVQHLVFYPSMSLRPASDGTLLQVLPLGLQIQRCGILVCRGPLKPTFTQNSTNLKVPCEKMTFYGCRGKTATYLAADWSIRSINLMVYERTVRYAGSIQVYHSLSSLWWSFLMKANSSYPGVKWCSNTCFEAIEKKFWYFKLVWRLIIIMSTTALRILYSPLFAISYRKLRTRLPHQRLQMIQAATL